MKSFKRRRRKSRKNNNGSYNLGMTGSGMSKLQVCSIPSVHKFIAALYTDQAISDAPTNLNPYNIAQGAVSLSTRLGLKIRATRVDFRLLFSASATDGHDTMRLIVAIPRLGSGLGGADLPQNLVDYIDPKLWVTVLDKMITLYVVQSDTGGPGVVRKQFIRTVPLNVTCTYVGVDIGDQALNPIYFTVLSDSNAIPHPTMSGSILWHFTDML